MCYANLTSHRRHIQSPQNPHLILQDQSVCWSHQLFLQVMKFQDFYWKKSANAQAIKKFLFFLQNSYTSVPYSHKIQPVPESCLICCIKKKNKTAHCQSISFCAASGWDRVNFLHRSPHETVLDLGTKTVLITHWCFGYCWIVLPEHQSFLFPYSASCQQIG